MTARPGGRGDIVPLTARLGRSYPGLVLLGSRFAVLIGWLISPVRFSAALSSFIWPVPSIIFLLWTMLKYLMVWSPVTGDYGLYWLLLRPAVLCHIGMCVGGFGNRDRMLGYSQLGTPLMQSLVWLAQDSHLHTHT